MIGWILIAVIWTAIAASGGYVIGSGLVRETPEKALERMRLNGIVVERDSLLEEVAEYCEDIKTLEGHLAEADVQLQASVQEIHGLREERKSLQLQLQEALKPRDVKSEQETPQETEYEAQPEPAYYVKPGAVAQLNGAEKTKRKRRAGQAVTTGEDGER